MASGGNEDSEAHRIAHQAGPRTRSPASTSSSHVGRDALPPNWRPEVTEAVKAVLSGSYQNLLSLPRSLRNDIQYASSVLQSASEQHAPFFTKYASAIRHLKGVEPGVTELADNLDRRVTKQLPEALQEAQSVDDAAGTIRAAGERMDILINNRSELETLIHAPRHIEEHLEKGDMFAAVKIYFKIRDLRSNDSTHHRTKSFIDLIWDELHTGPVAELKQAIITAVKDPQTDTESAIELLNTCVDIGILRDADETATFFTDARVSALPVAKPTTAEVAKLKGQFLELFGSLALPTFCDGILSYTERLLKEAYKTVQTMESIKLLADWHDDWDFAGFADLGMDVEMLLGAVVKDKVLRTFAKSMSSALQLLPKTLTQNSLNSNHASDRPESTDSINVSTVDFEAVSESNTSLLPFVHACLDALEDLSHLANTDLLVPSSRILCTALDMASERCTDPELSNRVSPMLKACLLRGVFHAIWMKGEKSRKFMLKAVHVVR